MNPKVGRPIPVGDVLSKSTTMLLRTPNLIFPWITILALLLIGDVVSDFGVVTTLISLVASVIVVGAYPSLVQAVLNGSQLSVGDSMKRALARFWTLLGALIIVSLIVLLGFIAIIVPGIILATWYAYTVPAIMLEDKGALSGMSASKAFGRDKKWSTFLISLVIALVAIVILAIGEVVTVGSPLAGRIVYSILSVPLYAWIVVIFTYTYITCGPMSVPPPTETSIYGEGSSVQFPSQSGQATSPPDASASNYFCRYCGASIEPDARFCSVCGKAL